MAVEKRRRMLRKVRAGAPSGETSSSVVTRVYSLVDLPPRQRRRGSLVEGPRGFGTASGEVNNEASKIESHDSEPGTCNGWITWYHQDCGT